MKPGARTKYSPLAFWADELRKTKPPVGTYEHAAYTNRYPNNKISTVKYIKLNRKKIYNRETKK
jgi:hypothetical protein